MAFVNVDGEVTRVHSSGNGFGLKESWRNRDGGEMSRFWAVFPKEPVQVGVGDVVKVSGALSTKVTEPKADRNGVERVYVDHTVGSAKVEVVSQGQATVPAVDAWASTPSAPQAWGGDNAPF